MDTLTKCRKQNEPSHWRCVDSQGTHMFMILCMPFVAQSYIYPPKNTMTANGNTRTQKILPILPPLDTSSCICTSQNAMYEKHGAIRAIQITLYDQPPPRSLPQRKPWCFVMSVIKLYASRYLCRYTHSHHQHHKPFAKRKQKTNARPGGRGGLVGKCTA